MLLCPDHVDYVVIHLLEADLGDPFVSTNLGFMLIGCHDLVESTTSFPELISSIKFCSSIARGQMALLSADIRRD